MPAKKGNTNALKHGLYARHFSKEEKADLAKMDSTSLAQELALLRVIADRAIDRLDEITDSTPEALGAYARLLSSLTATITGIATIARTEAILQGTADDLSQAIADALDATTPYIDQDGP